METFNWMNRAHSYDKRRNIIIPGNADETVDFCSKQFIHVANACIKSNGIFTVALSGGSTPNAIFKKISQSPYREQLDWSKVLCFWSDERSVPPTHPDSNFGMAMESGLAALPLLKEHIFRMKGEGDIEANAYAYEKAIVEFVPSCKFDLMMLGIGEDGHTASLFPQTNGLHTTNRLAIANYVPQKQTWRFSLTYECINSAHLICIYAIGKNKSEIVSEVLKSPYEPDHYPVQGIGTEDNKANWIIDQEAASKIIYKE